jgi:hypothetical protein
MNRPELHDQVRLTQALPTLWLQCGDVGMVLSIWLSSPEFYEVEFHKDGESFSVRALVSAENLEVVSVAPTNKPDEVRQKIPVR